MNLSYYFFRTDLIVLGGKGYMTMWYVFQGQWSSNSDTLEQTSSILLVSLKVPPTHWPHANAAGGDSW